MFYLIKTTWWLKRLYNSCIWDMPVRLNRLYLTFDDGPHPTITPWVLDELKKYNAKATFFCIGNNVKAYPAIYDRIKAEGHAVGNHSFDHVNGWNIATALYVANVDAGAAYIDSTLFRPPYGKITYAQIKALQAKKNPYKIIMWNVLSGDFDENISAEKCLHNVLKNTREGNMIVFHDSEKAYVRMSYALPLILEHFSKKGYTFERIDI